MNAKIPSPIIKEIPAITKSNIHCTLKPIIFFFFLYLSVYSSTHVNCDLEMETIWTGSFGFKVPKEFCGRDYDLPRSFKRVDGESERINPQQRTIGSGRGAETVCLGILKGCLAIWPDDS